MSKFVRSLVLTILIIMVVVLIAGCSSRFEPQRAEGASLVSPSPGSSSHEPANGLVQSNSGGQVTIEVKWIREGDGLIVFDVAMNTHEVDLDQYDLGKLAVLRDDEGEEYSPVSWEADPGGHHRQGSLSFPLPDSLSQGKVKYVEMIIRDVAGIDERVLRWEF